MDIEQLAGTRLGNYEIESLLGRGGMGVVYKARQISLNRAVALKILPPTLSSEASFVKRFQREAEAVAQLDHSNIVQIFDISKAKGLHFFSMQYIEGRALDEVLKEQGCLDASEAVRIISQAAQGIEHAHKNGIIHRDIKPSNIILDDSGNVKVMDFGLARSTEERSKLTRSGTLMGTLDYMSPEQCQGDELDGRTDIYSLGVVLYEILTGKAPFDAPNEAALLNKIINEEPPKDMAVNPEISSGLSTILSKMMAKDRANRYKAIPELLEEIEKIRSLPSSSSAISQEESSASIVVLPFINMSADPDQEYFCDGLAEELINALTQLSDLRVVARTSAFSFKGKEMDVREIGTKLNVNSVLEGSVRKLGNRIRVMAQLVDVTNGYHLWSERFDREMNDVFAIQDEITQAIVDKLKIRFLGEEKNRLAKRMTVDLEAYDLYLKGRYFWGKMTEEALEKAINFFKQSIKKAPDHALAYVGLADSYGYHAFYGFSMPKENMPKMREAILRALKIDDSLGEAHASLGLMHIYDWNWKSAEEEFIRAIELNPGYAETYHWYGHLLMVLGRFDEGLRQMELARKLDPLSLLINRCVGITFFQARRYPQGTEALRRTIELDPAFPFVHAFLGLTLLGQGMPEKAMTEFENEAKISGGEDAFLKTNMGQIYAMTGRIDEARQILNELLERAQSENIPKTPISQLYFVLGEEDKGFEFLDKAYEEHDEYLIFAKIQPGFDTVRSDPRFVALLQKVGLDK